MSARLIGGLLAVLAAYSIIALVVGGQLDQVLRDAVPNLPWLSAGIVLSEVVLTIGLGMMATAAGIVGGREILKGRARLRDVDWRAVAAIVDRSRVFWSGFWLSLVGGCGDGIVIALGVGRSLPVSSWGLLLLPFADVLLTIGLRSAVYRTVRQSPRAAGSPPWADGTIPAELADERPDAACRRG